jgi:hypothetical protein
MRRGRRGEVAVFLRKTGSVVFLLFSLMALATTYSAPVVLSPFVFSLPYPDRLVRARARLALSLLIPIGFDFMFSLPVPAYFAASLVFGLVLRAFLPIINVKHPAFPMFSGVLALACSAALTSLMSLLRFPVWRLTPADVFLYVALPYWVWGLARWGAFAPRDEFPVSV